MNIHLFLCGTLNAAHLLRNINDPEHPRTLEELSVVQLGACAGHHRSPIPRRCSLNPVVRNHSSTQG